MADQFLNKDGVKTLWAKIKSLVSGKLDKSGGTITGDLIVSNGNKITFHNPNYGLGGIYVATISANLGGSVGNEVSKSITAPTNTAAGSWYLIIQPYNPFCNTFIVATEKLNFENGASANVYFRRVVYTGSTGTVYAKAIWLKIW